MQINLQFLLSNLLDWILRRKNLNSVLYILCLFFIKELTALSAGPQVLIFSNYLTNEFGEYRVVEFISEVINLLFSSGSIHIIVVTVCAIIAILFARVFGDDGKLNSFLKLAAYFMLVVVLLLSTLNLNKLVDINAIEVQQVFINKNGKLVNMQPKKLDIYFEDRLAFSRQKAFNIGCPDTSLIFDITFYNSSDNNLLLKEVFPIIEYHSVGGDDIDIKLEPIDISNTFIVSLSEESIKLFPPYVIPKKGYGRFAFEIVDIVVYNSVSVFKLKFSFGDEIFSETSSYTLTCGSIDDVYFDGKYYARFLSKD